MTACAQPWHSLPMRSSDFDLNPILVPTDPARKLRPAAVLLAVDDAGGVGADQARLASAPSSRPDRLSRWAAGCG